MIGKFLCWWNGKHLRGKRVECQDNGQIKVFACPRCGRRTQYRAEQKSA